MERFTVPGGPLGVDVEVTLERGAVTRVRLTRAPEPDTALSEAARLVRASVARHLLTGAEDFARLRVDLSGTAPFHRETLETLLREVPAGRIVTYGELAEMLGKGPGAARAIGGAMAANPIPLLVPCHRVVAANRVLGHYSGEGGAETKRRLLELERAPGYASVQVRLF